MAKALQPDSKATRAPGNRATGKQARRKQGTSSQTTGHGASTSRASAECTAPALPFRPGRGGARPGAGRKPNIPGQPGVDHRPRAPLTERCPVHVTLKLSAGLPRLRSKPAYETLRAAIAASSARNTSGAFRLCHYAVLDDHLHLICEAEGRTALSRGLQGLLIRIARALNKLWSRRGSVFADRYHDHILESPREVRNVLRNVFGNGRKHAAEGREVDVSQAIDT
jgi:REP element-mobilizing transposase RayT